MNTAPSIIDEGGWSDQVAAYFTFGPGFTTGMYVITVIGILILIGILIAWVNIDDHHIRRATDEIRAREGGPVTGGATTTTREVHDAS